MDPVARGQLAKPLDDAAFALAVGQVSGIVSTPEGFHILKVEEVAAAVTVSEAQARAQIRGFLEQTRANAAIEKEAERLRSGGKVDILLPL
jgi:parvulin-like peptidyl-prolyl isomerase